jgi:hypothetical protein
MAKYQVEMHYSDGTIDLDPDVFDTIEDAEDHGNYLCSCNHQGARILNMSNPGDYPLDDDDDVDFEIVQAN